ncbi:hypothetical protein KDA06_02985 [Candidatus Saccharibacteria bacterium]|jgi:hypothetical protein|nr:hypothetical protein [Candidatus Saccharibacteria bacterium]HPR09288.1 pilin [Candidatus Saccharibacteria bacterium]
MHYIHILQKFAADSPNVDIDVTPLPQPAPNDASISVILSILFGVMASVALLIIVIAGLRYILSNGDPGAMAKAKGAIIYAVVGLLISMSGFGIVTFVLKGL